MQRFVYGSGQLGETITLSEPELVHQIIRVLRMRAGESCILFPGDGSPDSIYAIESLDAHAVVCRLIERRDNTSDPTLRLTLCHAIPNRPEKMELVIQKGTEIGCREFLFYRSDRSQSPLPPPKKLDRLHMIAREATEQCGGGYLPTIEILDTRDPVFAPESTIVLDMDGIPLHTWLDTCQTSDITALIGPEGGWSDRERVLHTTQGYTRVSLGSRVLRTETAGIVIAGILLMGR